MKSIPLRACAITFASLLLLGGPPQSAAQTQNPPTIRRSTSLVLVPVSALDKSGNFVSGLTASNFHILVDGKPVEIASFDAITEGSPPFTGSPSTTAALPPNTFRNISEFSASQPNLVIFFIDYLNTRLVDRMELRDALLKYLTTKFKPGQEIAVYGLTQRLVLLQSFTRDPLPLIAAAKDLLNQKGQSPDPRPSMPLPLLHPGAEMGKTGGGDEAMEFFEARNARLAFNIDQLDRAKQTLQAFRELARSFAGISGKKTLVWLTGDVSPLNPSMLYRMLINDEPLETVPTPWWEMAKTYELLNTAGISVFPVDIRGIMNPGLLSADQEMPKAMLVETLGGSWPGEANPYFSPRDLWEGEAANAALGMEAVAAETGGTVLAGGNDVDELLDRAHKIWDSYYVLSFVPEKPPDDGPPSYHTIKVKVDRHGVNVLARRGYTSRPETLISADSEIQHDLLEAETSPIDLTSVAMQLTLRKSKDTGHIRQFSCLVTVPGTLLGTASDNGAPYDLTIAGLVRDQDGKFKPPVGTRLKGIVPQSAILRASREGLTYKFKFLAPIGSPYFGRVIVRDNLTGRIGTLTLTLPTSSAAD